MADISKISPDDGSTILNIKDSNAVHWADNTILGAKNLLKNTATTQTISDVIFTRNSDGSMTANGTASAYIEYPVLAWSEHDIPLGQYILSGCPTGGANNKYRLLVQFSNSISGTSPTNYIEYGDGINVNDVSKSYMRIMINISSGQVVNNLTFKPMLRLASDTDTTYAPYAMTNRELTEVSEVPISIPSALSSKITLNANSKVYRQGNVVTGSIRISITDTLSAGSDLCDLGGIKPKYLTYTSGIKNSDGSVMPVIQNTTGRIVLFGQFIPAVGSDLIIPINYMCE